MAKNKARTIEDPVQQELEEIKRLLILLLMKAGTPQGEISKALGIAQSALSTMMPARAFTSFEEK